MVLTKFRIIKLFSLSLRAKGVAIQFLKKLYILWITSDFSNPRNDKVFAKPKKTLKKLNALKICNI